VRKKKEDDGYNTSVPDLIAEIRASKAVFLRYPALSLPWPRFVPPPESLDANIAALEEAFQETSDHNEMDAVGTLQRTRRELKTTVGKIVRYVEMLFDSAGDLQQWPGFDLTRHPGERRRSRASRRPRNLGGRQSS
jgi:hypothetical protein